MLTAVDASIEPQSLSELNALAVEDLALVDIGRVNLLCAEGLVGSERLDVSVAVSQLDEMAAATAELTRRYWSRFEKSSDQFQHSEAYFRVMVLVTVLQRDFGVAYDVDWFERPPDFTDSRAVFIHGILAGRGGTCSSLPVLFAAVGRRLGYPLKLVSSVSHLFLRWDDSESGERFNIETTAQGMVCHPDQHYRTWPKPMRSEDLAGEYYLTSFTPQQELAGFFITRARCFFDWLAFDKAMELALRACGLFPAEPNFQRMHAISTVLHREVNGLARHSPAGSIVMEHGRLRPIEPWERWASVEAEKELLRLRQVHEARRPRITNQIDAAFAALNS